MAEAPKDPFKMSHSMILRPAREDSAFPISFRNFDRLRQRIAELQCPKRWLSILSSFLFGICGSCIVTLVALPEAAFKADSRIALALWITLGVAALAGIITLLVDLKLEDRDNSTKRKHIDDMLDMLSDPYKK